jgi:hypothetical protein
MPIAVLDDGDALDVLHGEVGPARAGGPGLINMRDVRVVQQGQGLSFGLEPGDHLATVHAGLDDLERDAPSDRLVLVGQVHHPVAALAEDADELIGPDLCAWTFRFAPIPGRTFWLVSTEPPVFFGIPVGHGRSPLPVRIALIIVIRPRPTRQDVDKFVYFRYELTCGLRLPYGASGWIYGWIGKTEATGVAILAGIDEAGYGPLLGPLVVSASVFRVDPALLEADLWQTFKRSVGKTRKHLVGRLLIADSKKAYDRTAGLGHLERTVLALLQSMGNEPANLNELLGILCPDCLPRLAEYPWHQDLQSCCLGAGAADRRIAARVFADDAQAHGAKLLYLRSCCLDVAYYNRMVDMVNNKSQVLFITTTRLIQGLLDAFPGEDIHVQVDRQGGRAHYREHLLRSFPGMDLRIVREDEECSAYEMRTASRMLRLTFEIKGDDRYLPVSAASMVSKYVRELLMEGMNRYFVGLDAGLTPTAGYWQDGLRFLDDLKARLPNLKIDRQQLIRSR